MPYVYLIKSNETSYYKIGYSNNPNRRISQLQTSAPDKLTLINVYESINARRIEVGMHNTFNYARKNNEWFELCLEDELKFTSLCEDFNRNIELIKNF